jgi:hypothetical protein
MNALDFLFDFVALMSSSAMSLPPCTNKVQDVPAQEPQASDLLLIQGAQVPNNNNGHPQQATQTPYPQVAAELPSISLHEDNIAAFSRSHASDVNQKPIVWIPEPPYPQHAQYAASSHQSPHLPDYSQLTPLPGFDCNFPCGHHPNQRCHCMYIPTAEVCTSYGSTSPYAHDQMSLQAPQQFQYLPGDRVMCEYDWDNHYFDQPCKRQYFPAHNHSMKNGRHVPVIPQEMWDINQLGLDISPHTHHNGQIAAENLMAHP